MNAPKDSSVDVASAKRGLRVRFSEDTRKEDGHNKGVRDNEYWNPVDRDLSSTSTESDSELSDDEVCEFKSSADKQTRNLHVTKKSQEEKTLLDLEKLSASICEIAKLRGVPHENRKTIFKWLKLNQFFFAQNKDTYVQLRIARKPAPKECKQTCVESKESAVHIYQLNFRSEVFSAGTGRANMLQILNRQDNQKSKPVMFMRMVTLQLPICAVAADFDPKDGLVKLWHFGRYSVDQVAKIPFAPSCLHNYISFFKKHGFHKVCVCGVDLHKLSMNVYFDLHESGQKTESEILEIFDNLHLTGPQDDELRYISGCGSFTMTFAWGSDSFQRICFYVVPALSQLTAEVADFMEDTALPHSATPLGGETLDKNDLAHPNNSRFVSISYYPDESGKTQKYFKQESDWYNNYYTLLDRCGKFAMMS